jgi:hypothetical protein
MTTATKAPTSRGISAVLRKAGFEKSESSSTRIRGYHSTSYGYHVSAYGSDEVRVHHYSGKFMPSDADQAHSREMEDRYAEAIEAAGYKVERTDFGGLAVVAKTPEGEQ